MKLYMFRTDELSETSRVSRQNKFVKLVHLVGFITKKFLTTHGYMNVKKIEIRASYFKISIAITVLTSNFKR
jgi:hypothetical protein